MDLDPKKRSVAKYVYRVIQRKLTPDMELLSLRGSGLPEARFIPNVLLDYKVTIQLRGEVK